MKLQTMILRILCVTTWVVASATSFAVQTPAGPRTVAVEASDYQQTYHVSQTTGSNNTGDGSRAKPWQTLQHALANCQDASENKRYAVLVASGIYLEPSLYMKSHVDCFGGFDPRNWHRDIIKHSTILDGASKHRILTGADHARLDGFIIRAGSVRGYGAGLLCDNTSPIVTNNRFVENRTKKPKNWSPEFWHAHANDGGAIYCVNGASPTIKHNIFADNHTEIGRGAAVAFHDHCGGEISYCVFLDNTAGTDDQDRSSDGGAISVFDWSSPRIENNILLENKALNSNDGGGIFIALWSSPAIRKNVFVGNRAADDAGALFVGGQEHRYDSPKDPVPDEEQFCVEISANMFYGNENRSLNSGGMRLTMQARAKVENNILAHDARFQIQACEAKIVNNTITEDTIIEEMPPQTGAELLAQNVFWARLHVREKSKKLPPDAQCVGEKPRFLDDQLTLDIQSSTYSPEEHVTTIQVTSEELKNHQLTNRVVRFEHRWGVVKSNRAGEIIVWGDVSGDTKLVVLPSFQLHPLSPGIDRGPRQK